MRNIPQHKAVTHVLVGGHLFALERGTCDVKGGGDVGEGATLTGKLATTGVGPRAPGDNSPEGGTLRCEVKFVQAVVYE